MKNAIKLELPSKVAIRLDCLSAVKLANINPRDNYGKHVVNRKRFVHFPPWEKDYSVCYEVQPGYTVIGKEELVNNFNEIRKELVKL